MTTIKVIHNLGDTEYLVLKSMIGDVGKFSVSDNEVNVFVNYGRSPYGIATQPERLVSEL